MDLPHDNEAAPLDPADFAALPEIGSMGMMLFDPIWAQRRHPASKCEIIHVVRGKVRLEMPGGPFHATAGGTLLVPQGTMHRDAFDLRTGLEVLFCTFTWNAQERYFRHVDNRAISRMGADRRAELGELFDQLRAGLTASGTGDQLVARSRLLTILLIILRETLGEERPRRDRRRSQLMLGAKRYLEAHYQGCIALDDIAAALGVSAYHISHVFSEESDFSLFGYLTNLRMKKARLLLEEGGGKVAEIAAAVGYADANYFAKAFKRHYGLPPREVLRGRGRSGS